jgi:glucokinase
MTQTFIIWDLGATKCGVGKVTVKEHQYTCEKIISLQHKNHHSLDELVEDIESVLHLKHAQVDKVLIAGAGIYDGHILEHTNPYPFRMDFARIGWERDWPMFRVVHDYVPVLCSTFTPYIYDPKYVLSISSGVYEPSGRHVVFGVGTGLGLKDGVLLPNGKIWVGSNEMGHVGIALPPLADGQTLARHQAFTDFMRHHSQPAMTFESILSGNGLTRIHEFFTQKKLTPSEISALLHESRAEETLSLFAWYLGLFVGCVQLAFMPSGGLWVTGGVLKKNPMIAQHPAVIEGIQAHPAYDQVRKAFPLAFILHDELAYIGGAWYTSCID